MMERLHQLASDARRRAMMAVGRCVLAAVDDSKKCQVLQLQLLDGETQDGVERFQEYGFTSVPLAGAEGVMVSVGGLRSHGVVVAVEDRRHRPTGLQPGEGGLYDDQAQTILIKRDGIYIVTAKDLHATVTGTATITAGHCNLVSADVNLGAAGGKKVALDGDPVVGGVVQASSTKVKAV